MMRLCARFAFALAFVAMASILPAPLFAALPELPRVYLDTTYVPPTGSTIVVLAGGDFQAALNTAQLGDVITLEAGATFTGPFTLPNKTGTGWLFIRSSTADSNLPPPGTRVDPSYASVMPKIVSPLLDGLGNPGNAIRLAVGAHHYRFIGVEIKPAAGAFISELVPMHDDTASDFIFDRCYVHGDPAVGGRRGIAMNVRRGAVIDSYFADFKEVGADSQAIAGWGGAGPFKVVNNYLEGAGENLLFGGADPWVTNLIPSDIEIRRNYFFKPLSWKVGHPTYAGTPWTIKNLLELKNAQRVLLDGNLLENCWVGSQAGDAVLFTTRNQDGTAPWSVVRDVTFINNTVRHAAGGIQLLAQDFPNPSQLGQRFLIKNNLFDDIGSQWGADVGLFTLSGGAPDVVIEHNTGVPTYAVVVVDAAMTGFIFRNNIMRYGTYGIIGTGTGPGNDTINTYFPGAIVQKNAFAAGNAVADASLYPPGNFFLASLNDIGFVDWPGGNYRLTTSSPYKNAGTDGKDLGVDFAAQVPCG